MGLSTKNSQDIYKLIDKFNAKKYPVKFELRIIGDAVILYCNKKERFNDVVRYITDNENIIIKYQLYFEAFEEGYLAKSLKHTLEEL